MSQVPLAAGRVVPDGKFLRAGDSRFLVKGVSYGTFAPDARGYHFPPAPRVVEDFRQMASLGVNTVRVYTPPPPELLDEAATQGLRVMVGLPWSQHTAFLDDHRSERSIRRGVVAGVRKVAAHPAVCLIALGNEIPAGVVRWHGSQKVEGFLRRLYQEAKSAAPDGLFTYVNFPPTEFLDLSFLDVCAFNVFLHGEADLRRYLARLQNVAGNRPLLLAEAGADSLREGQEGQAKITAMQVRVAFEEGVSGAIAFSWTDEWWRAGEAVENWAFGLVDRERRPKPAAARVSRAFANAPFPAAARASWPKVSVVVCAYDAAETLSDCLGALQRLDYPDFEVLLVNDGSRDRTSEIAHGHAGVRVIDTPNQGLGVARNVGLAAATGEIVAYVDADVRVDPQWLTYLVQPFLGAEEVVGSGGPNVVPADDPRMAQCIARAPGGPTHVLLDDRVAEHVPGCNMAFRRSALLEIGGFNPIYLRAGDDVDICWRLQARGWRIGFASAALVWHHHRTSVGAYWRQQVGYGEGESWLMAQHPEKFLDGRMLWRGRIYSPLPAVRSLSGQRVNAGVWGTAAFPSGYRRDAHPLAYLPHTVQWQLGSAALLVLGVLALVLELPALIATLALGGGLLGAAATLAKNVVYAVRSDVSALPGAPWRYRLTIAWLHFLQPAARAWGRVRGALTPPEAAQLALATRAERGPEPSLLDGWRAALLLSGSVTENRYWSERWMSAEQVLTGLTEQLRRARPRRTVAVDEGWSLRRDVSLLVGRWAWLDVRVLVEEHERGRCLLRTGTSLRPTALGATAAVGLGAALLVAATAGAAYGWPFAGGLAALLTLAATSFAASRTAAAAATLRRAVEHVAGAQGMTLLPVAGVRRPRLRGPSPLRASALRTAAGLVIILLWVGAGTLLLRQLAQALGPEEPPVDRSTVSIAAPGPDPVHP